jgi:hypothetical protein
MAWRPNDQFIEGVMDNTVPNKITGWMKFAGMKERVVFVIHSRIIETHICPPANKLFNHLLNA